MFFSLKANKKRIIAFLILIVVVAGACFLLSRNTGGSDGEAETVQIKGGTNEERVQFLKAYSWEVEQEAIEMREVKIPEKFNDVYTKYNDMQKAQGFDLKPYAGYNCMQYKYKILNYPESDCEVYATLLVYNDYIIGGDLAATDVNGFMHGFAIDSMRYGEEGYTPSEGSNQTAITSSPSSEAESAVADDTERDTSSSSDETAAPEGEESSAPEQSAQDSATDVIADDAYPID